MIYSPLTKKAMKIAFDAHDGQLDKGGIPYVNHPLHLAEQMESENEIIVALLHDVVEDSEDKYDINSLRENGFPEEVICAIELLTHKKGVPYLDYVETLKKNDLARKVKLADLEHNLTISRAGNITERMSKKMALYQEAKAILLENKFEDNYFI